MYGLIIYTHAFFLPAGKTVISSLHIRYSYEHPWKYIDGRHCIAPVKDDPATT
jgi:hypothetical protein